MQSLTPPQFDGEPEPFASALIEWFSNNADERYSERVSQLEHALQCAHLASEEGATSHEVVAALLHDVGHVLMLKPRMEGKGDARDLRHEQVGATWLQRVYPDSVCAPIRLHVPAKRYLCATDDGYWDTLSAGSKHSLELQGGPMNAKQVEAFESLDFWRSAVDLRKRDERAKTIGADVPNMSSYKDLLIECIR